MYLYMHAYTCVFICMYVCSAEDQTRAVCTLGKLCSTSVDLVFVSVLLCVENKTSLHVSG